MAVGSSGADTRADCERAPGGPPSSLQYCALPNTDAGGGSSPTHWRPVMIQGLGKLGYLSSFVISGYFPSHAILHVKNPRLGEKGLPTRSFIRPVSIQCRSAVSWELGGSLYP